MTEICGNADAMRALERAAGSVARFDAATAFPDLRALWSAFALPDEAAAQVRLQGGVCARPRLRLVAAGAQLERATTGDRRGLLMLRGVHALHDRPDERVSAWRMRAFLRAAVRSKRLQEIDGKLADRTLGAIDEGPADGLLGVYAGVERLLQGGWDADVVAGVAGGLLGRRSRTPMAPLFLSSVLETRGATVPSDATGRLVWVMETVRQAADRQITMIADLIASREEARARIERWMEGASERARGLRRDSGLMMASDALIGQEVLTTAGLREALAVDGLCVTQRTAQRLLDALAACGVAKEATGRRHFRVWVPTELPLARLRADEADGVVADGPTTASAQAPASPLSQTAPRPRPDRDAEAAWRDLANSGDELIRDIRRLLGEAKRVSAGVAGSEDASEDDVGQERRGRPGGSHG